VAGQFFWPSARDNIGVFLTDSSPLPTTADPAVNSIAFDLSTVRVGDSFTITLSGANLSSQTYFDVRFRAPGATSDDVVENWQQGASVTHNVPAGTASGAWKITGMRAHRDASDHSASFIPVPATLTVP
jgi:hypothetical protein